jgi:predicted ATPase
VIKSLKLTNFLSFGPSTKEVDLGNLNVLIGPNGSGKSNFLAAIDLLTHAPLEIEAPIRWGGGAAEWVRKRVDAPSGFTPVATIDATLELNERLATFSPAKRLRYELVFGSIQDELRIKNEEVHSLDDFNPVIAYSYREEAKEPKVGKIPIDPGKSILSQRRGPQYAEISALSFLFSHIACYRDWQFGPYASIRNYQRSELPMDRLTPHAENFAGVLHRLLRIPGMRENFGAKLHAIYDGIDSVDVDILPGGSMQIFLYEKGMKVAAPRLSDGTLRFLWLLTVLCDPDPSPLICIDEPELGLHPDVLPTLADLFREASERSQFIVTTHSDVLVDAMTDTPEAVLVCEKGEEGSVIRRLDPEQLKPWLEEYRLGELWTRGHIVNTLATAANGKTEQ